MQSLRNDFSFLTSLCLLGLVALAALTGMGMDEYVGGLVPLEELDDLHPLAGYGLALIAGLHVLLQLGKMRAYVSRRLRASRRRGRRRSPSTTRLR
jgi:hypothetical protein